MSRLIIFSTLSVVCCAYALTRGGAPERIGTVILIANFQLSRWVVAPFDALFGKVEWAMFAVDLTAFVALYVMSLFSARYWPIWIAAVQGVVALTHLAGLWTDFIIPWAYGNAVALWSYVLLAMLAVATWRHRVRLRRYGIDPAWRGQLPPSYREGQSAGDARFPDSVGTGR
ncbi:hypothetical protein FJQ54_12490 [Sandaracinobacter neustonicus]|uniref:Uncharacterized protein n=1 Tax=Sandaracinobacter neustonicus TaxID=1715348 RepID=A0A501XGS8_9SPHN|nr:MULTISPECIES: hypothetical protein [Alphaproteobacteria]TPE59750.1 hypothetical protein FJQ54_12490 [Sandaracinobacter neustonicus]HBI20129.1 hypothetical protein [Brevundimonas sp.]